MSQTSSAQSIELLPVPTSQNGGPSRPWIRPLRALGVHGYDHLEPVIFAALVTGDPLLLIGKAGTGKTYLLNRLADALGLEHRHYNASLIAFDDLVGFPFPDNDRDTVRYLQTPATVWQAESVLIDEINRCKPEHQNRLFSLVHERRIQGLKLERLRYCWAAMNPCTGDQTSGDFYDGAVALDQALADRFPYIIQVPDWEDLSETDRQRVADPSRIPFIPHGRRDQRLLETVNLLRSRFQEVVREHRSCAACYAVSAASALGTKGIRLSPRRVRMLSKNILALLTVEGGEPRAEVFRLALHSSLPHAAWGAAVDEPSLRAVHETAWASAHLDGQEKWLHSILHEPRLERKIARLLQESPDNDSGAVAVHRLLATLTPDDQAVFALCLYPAALQGKTRIGAEGVAALAKVAGPMLEVDAEIRWREVRRQTPNGHPGLNRCSRVLAGLSGRRQKRARQIFYHLLSTSVELPDPEFLEQTLDLCIRAVSSILGPEA